MAAVKELENTLADDILQLRKQVQYTEARHADDQRRMQALQDEIDQIKTQYAANSRLQETRMDTMAAQLAAISTALRSANREADTNSGNSSPLAANLAAYALRAHRRDHPRSSGTGRALQ